MPGGVEAARRVGDDGHRHADKKRGRRHAQGQGGILVELAIFIRHLTDFVVKFMLNGGNEYAVNNEEK